MRGGGCDTPRLLGDQVSRLLHDPGTGRVVGAASQVDAATADLDEEQRVRSGQPDGVYHEEVGRQDLIGVLADELAPSPMAAAPAAGVQLRPISRCVAARAPAGDFGRWCGR